MCVRETESCDENVWESHGLGTRNPEREVGGSGRGVSRSLSQAGWSLSLSLSLSLSHLSLSLSSLSLQCGLCDHFHLVIVSEFVQVFS